MNGIMNGQTYRLLGEAPLLGIVIGVLPLSYKIWTHRECTQARFAHQQQVVTQRPCAGKPHKRVAWCACADTRQVAQDALHTGATKTA